MSSNKSRYDRLVNNLEQLTEDLIGQQNYTAMMKEVARLMELEDSGRVDEKKIPGIAEKYKDWAKNNLWPRYLRDVGVPLERRVRMAICFSRPVAITMQNELKNNAAEYDEEGRLCRVEVGGIDWKGKHVDHKFNNVGDTRRRKNKKPAQAADQGSSGKSMSKETGQTRQEYTNDIIEIGQNVLKEQQMGILREKTKNHNAEQLQGIVPREVRQAHVNMYFYVMKRTEENGTRARGEKKIRHVLAAFKDLAYTGEIVLSREQIDYCETLENDDARLDKVYNDALLCDFLALIYTDSNN